jgi:hypothetical protein
MWQDRNTHLLVGVLAENPNFPAVEGSIAFFEVIARIHATSPGPSFFIIMPDRDVVHSWNGIPILDV